MSVMPRTVAYLTMAGLRQRANHLGDTQSAKRFNTAPATSSGCQKQRGQFQIFGPRCTDVPHETLMQGGREGNLSIALALPGDRK